jgi:hypothetical protein
VEGLPVGTNTILRAESTDSGAQALGVPRTQVWPGLGASPGGAELHAHTSAPVRTSTARIRPGGMSTRALSAMLPPKITLSPITTGGDETQKSPVCTSPRPSARLSEPL